MARLRSTVSISLAMEATMLLPISSSTRKASSTFLSKTSAQTIRAVRVSVELTETRTARIVWAEVFDKKVDDAFLVLDEIGNSIVASIASEIETVERNRAILKPPSSLDAWEAHHRGLWHMYRFNREDKERARHFFEMVQSQSGDPQAAIECSDHSRHLSPFDPLLFGMLATR